MADRNVTYRLRGDAQDFTRVVNRAEATLSGSFRKMQQSSGRGGKAITRDYESISRSADTAQLKVKGLVTAVGGFALGGGGLLAFADSITQAADRISDSSEFLGISTDEFQRYEFAAEAAGVATNQFASGFSRFTRRVGRAGQGLGTAAPALESLNIKLRDVSGNLRPANQLFDEAVIKLTQIEDVTLRNALASALFGNEAASLVKIGNNLETLKRKADELGVIIPPESLENAGKLTEQMDVLRRVLQAKLTAALIKLAPQLDALAEGALYAADNFDSIVSALGTFAKILIAIKLGLFIKSMFGVAAGSLAAARGVRALTLSLQGLKAATFVGLGLIALEIAIKKFLDSVDDSGQAVEDSLEKTEKAIEDSTNRITQQYDDVSSELVQQRENYNKNIDKLVKEEIKTLEKALKAQEKVVSEQRSLLEKATSDAEAAADEFAEAFDKIGGKNTKVENPDLIDVAGEITAARRLLSQGDNEGAVDAALRAKDVVLALQETGNYTEAQLSGTLKKAQQVQETASGALVEQQEGAVQKAETALQKIQSQINLIKSIDLQFDETKSLANAKKVLDQIKSLIAKQPIVVPVELKPSGGVDAGDLEAPGFARGGFIRGPGTSTSDSILARLSRGEYVLRADAVKKYGLDFLNQLNAGRLPGFATGGLVQATAAAGRSGTPMNLNLNGRNYPMTTTPDTADRLRRDTYVEQLKKGRRV